MQTSTRRLFTAVRAEGALLPADLLGRIVEGDSALKGLTTEDYHLLPGERLNEALSGGVEPVASIWSCSMVLLFIKASSCSSTPSKLSIALFWRTVCFIDLTFPSQQADKCTQDHHIADAAGITASLLEHRCTG